MTTQNTWFDAFFTALTSSPEFKSVMNTEWKDISAPIENGKNKIKEKSLDMAQDAQQTASSLLDQLNGQFSHAEVMQAAKEAEQEHQKSSQETPQDDTLKQPPLQVQYFENKNPQTFGFAWVAGMQDLKEELLSSFVRPLQFKFFIQKLKLQDATSLDEKTKLYVELYEKYEKFGVWIPTWVMLYGPPGTGKTFLTKKLAEELWAGLIVKSVWEFGSSYMHQTSKNIREFFQQAKELSYNEPIILFLDEIDSLVSKRTDKVDSNKAEEISQFLQEINALKEAPNLILVWATNRPDHLDSAIMRSGRFDKKIYLGPPDFEARKELFKIFIEKTSRPHDVLDYDVLAELTQDYVSADIQAICDEAARDASNSILDIMKLLQEDFEKHDIAKLKEDISKNLINMQLLEQAILDTPSSLKMVDMSVYQDWLKTLES